MRFKFLSGDICFSSYGGKFVSEKSYNHGDFDFWYVIEVAPIESVRQQKEIGAKYNVSLSIVAPSEASQSAKRDALRSCGIKETEISSQKMLVEIFHTYGLKANIFDSYGNNLKKLIREAHKEADTSISFLFGFQMDKRQNALGATGWDFLKGDWGF